MRYCRRKTIPRGIVLVLACMGLGLLSVLPGRAQVPPLFKVTSLVLNPDGTASLQWTGQDQGIVVQYTADVLSPLWQPVPGVEWPINGTSWSGAIPLSPGKGFIRVITTSGLGTAPIPLKHLSLSVMSWHDPQSDNFFNNCIACHGTKTQEVALDGVTPTAHSIMLGFYGQGNDRCVNCHYNGPGYTGPNFFNFSAGSLREQVNYEFSGCTTCHAKGGIIPLYDRY